MEIAKVAVVGAGTMGSGIAQVVSAAGLPVVLNDIHSGQLRAAQAHVESIYQRRVDRGAMTADAMRTMLSLIHYALDYDGFSAVDLAIEAVPEHLTIKKDVLAALNRVCPAEAILATNTSALSIADLAAASGRPRRLIGMHFFNPAHTMRLIEVIPGPITDPEVTEAVERLARRLSKIPIIVRECPGFLVNRMLMPYLNEAAICLQEGAATAEQIDAAMGPEGFGWPMGPLALMDLIGLDVCHHILGHLHSQYGERMPDAVLLGALVDRGRCGIKSGKGFYDYPGGVPSPEVKDTIRALCDRGAIPPSGVPFSADRVVLLLLNEAFRCVAEGIARIDDVDLACIAGLGMQVRSGGQVVRMGPLEYADELGLDVVLQMLQRLQPALGSRFEPAPILEHKVLAGETGKACGHGFRSYRTVGGDSQMG